MAEIRFEHVTKTYAGQIALEDVSFQIEKGEFVFIIGKSGAGKSTLLNLITKQADPTEGTISVFDQPLGGMKKNAVSCYRQRLGIMSPEVGVLKQMTVYENIALVIQATERGGRHIRDTIMRALGLVGIAGKAKAYPEELSGGELARMLLARAISTKPEILIADEPTANLDPDAAWDLMLLLQEIHSGGTTVIVSSHARELVTVMRQRVLTLVAGALVADEKHAIYNQKAVDIFEERRVLKERDEKLRKKGYIL